MGEYSIVERAGNLTIITINRPEVMNALHAPAHDEFSAIFDDFVAPASLAEIGADEGKVDSFVFGMAE